MPDTVRDPALEAETSTESGELSEVHHAAEHPRDAKALPEQPVPSEREESPVGSPSTVALSDDVRVDAEPQAPPALAPGDVPAPQVVAWTEDAAESLRDRWRELQTRFVDDPHGAAAEADDLVGEAVERLTAALAEQRQRLGSWRAGGEFDTEQLRVAVTRYREFLDRVLAV